MYIKELKAALALVNECIAKEGRTPELLAERNELLGAIYDEERLIQAYSRAYDAATDDATGQDLDTFLEEYK